MKKLIALIAVVGFVPPAFAQGMEMTHTGSYRLIYQNDMETDFAEGNGAGNDQVFSQRVRLGTMIKAGEKMNVNLGLTHAANWGANADQYPGDGDVTGGTANAQKDQLVVNEAYLNWMISDELMARAGRGSFTMADGSVVSSNDWEQIQKAFDGGMLTYDHEMARVSLFGVRGANGTAGKNSYGNFFGLSADFKSLPEWLKMANVHYVMVKRDADTYNVNGTASTLNQENAARYGVTLAGDTHNVDYRATYAMYTGEFTTGTTDQDIDANMYDVEVGYSMPDMMNFRVSVGYHSDSGQDSSSDNTRYTGFHYDTHNNAGLMDVVGWGNLTYTRVGFTLTPAEQVTVGANYYMFTATEKGDTVEGTDGVTTVAASTTEDDVGDELDVWATKHYTNNFAITARYGMFAPGDKIGSNADDRSQVYLEGSLTF